MTDPNVEAARDERPTKVPRLLQKTTKAMASTDLPATRPLYLESEIQRMSWQRQVRDAEDEKGMIDEQRESLARINAVTKDEAQRIYDARMRTAREAMDREAADADKIMAAGVTALDQRTADLDKVIFGLTAAMQAST